MNSHTLERMLLGALFLTSTPPSSAATTNRIKITSTRAQLVLLVTTVTVLSAFVKNIGALAMMLPVAFQMAKRSKTSPSVFLMPMAFGSLLGGLTTLIGTSPNIIVSRLRAEITGAPFAMFDSRP